MTEKNKDDKDPACGQSGSTVLLDDIYTRILIAQIGSCGCMTKTPNVRYHKQDCTYRVLSEAAIEIELRRRECGVMREALKHIISEPINAEYMAQAALDSVG